jgi:tripartite-type tricarboxylate transporter receptor subunit TctC
MNRLRTLMAGLAAACLPLIAAASAYPDKPIRLIVPYAAGGGADGAARIVAQRLSVALGQQVLIDNRAGGGGVIGADAAAKAAPDGYTVLFDASAFAANPALRKLPFDARKDFIPVSLVVVAPNILVVPPQSSYKTLQEFMAFARANPGKLNFGSAGNGSASHLAGETLNDLARIDLLHVPYKGGAPALNDLMGNQIASYFGNTASTLGHVKAGKLRALAVGSSRRLPALADVPTLAEAGLPGFVSQEWNGVFVPKGTPDEVVKRLAKELRATLAEPEVKAKLTQLGLEPVGNGPAEFAAFVKTEMAKAADIVKARNIKLD